MFHHKNHPNKKVEENEPTPKLKKTLKYARGESQNSFWLTTTRSSIQEVGGRGRVDAPWSMCLVWRLVKGDAYPGACASIEAGVGAGFPWCMFLVLRLVKALASPGTGPWSGSWCRGGFPWCMCLVWRLVKAVASPGTGSWSGGW